MPIRSSASPAVRSSVCRPLEQPRCLALQFLLEARVGDRDQGLRALPQIGCGRLEVTTRQRAVLVNGNRADQELAYQLNFCADGRFPEER